MKQIDIETDSKTLGWIAIDTYNSKLETQLTAIILTVLDELGFKIVR